MSICSFFSPFGLFLFIALNASAYGASHVNGSDFNKYEKGYTSVCNILKNEEFYKNKVFRISATLKTDNATYAYFENYPPNDRSCRGYNTISIASASVMHDASVVKFLDSTDDYCRVRHMQLCVVTVDMNFEAKILYNNAGPYLYLTRIFSYRYREAKGT